MRADHICGCGGDDNGMQSGEGAKFLSNRFQSILRELIVDRKKNQRYDSPKLIVKWKWTKRKSKKWSIFFGLLFLMELLYVIG